METYSKYGHFLDGTASLDIDDFLKKGEQDLSHFGTVGNNQDCYIKLLC